MDRMIKNWGEDATREVRRAQRQRDEEQAARLKAETREQNVRAAPPDSDSAQGKDNAMNSKHDCPWGCGPLIHDTRRETICILGHTIERMATGWWCDKCGEVVLGGADLAASEAATAERPKLMHLALDGAIGDLEVYAPEAAAHHTAKLAELYAS